MKVEPLAFPIETLAAATSSNPPLEVCPDGHLWVRRRTCWRPLQFGPGLKSILCEWVEHEVDADA